MSQRQREANRINGAKGGPKTLQGKEISKMNALRHGLTAKKLVLPSEDEALFNAMMEGYLEELQPQGLEETDLVREIVSGKWRQERHWVLENALTELAEIEAQAEIDDRFHEIDPIVRTAYSLARQHGKDKALEMVNRMEGRMRRLHQAARRDLDRLQAARIQKDPKPAPASAPKVRIPAPPPPIQDEPISIRSFVSKQELVKITKCDNEPKFLRDLPETMPEEDPNAA
jgi:hypothetical protein